MTTAKLDPALCRQMADRMRAMWMPAVTDQLTAAADLAERKTLTDQQVSEAIKRAFAEVDGDILDEVDDTTVAAIATRAAKELAGAVVGLSAEDLAVLDSMRAWVSPVIQPAAAALLDRLRFGSVVIPAQREADLREAVLYGIQWALSETGLDSDHAAAEYARSKAGGS